MSLIRAKEGTSLENKEIQIINAEGIVRTLLWNSAMIYDADGRTPVSIIIQGQDITNKKIEEENLIYLGYHDYLTDLYNRRFFEEEIKRIDIKRNLPLAIAMGDVNGLKLINDSFGHEVGDEILKKVATVIKKGCRDEDIVARLGGGEFAILFPKTNSSETEKHIERIKDLLSKEKAGSINISVSFGYEVKEETGEKVHDVLKNAEEHMYRHKLHESFSMRSKTIYNAPRK